MRAPEVLRWSFKISLLSKRFYASAHSRKLRTWRTHQVRVHFRKVRSWFWVCYNGKQNPKIQEAYDGAHLGKIFREVFKVQKADLVLWSSSSKGKCPCPATDPEPLETQPCWRWMAPQRKSFRSSWLLPRCVYSSKSHPDPGFCSRNMTTNLWKTWSNGTCRIWPGDLYWDLLEISPKFL